MNYLITGANRGIGLEMVRQLLARNERVFATCRNLESAASLQHLKIRFPSELEIVVLDVTSPDSIAACYTQVQQHTDALDILINNAGIGASQEVLGTITQETMFATYTVNASGPILVAQQFLPLIKAGEAKQIINISSGAGSIGSRKRGGMYAYAASKAALNMHSKNLSLDVAQFGITTIVIGPGWVKTDMGGPGAQITPEESVLGILNVLDSLTTHNNGKFFSYSGNEMPW